MDSTGIISLLILSVISAGWYWQTRKKGTGRVHISNMNRAGASQIETETLTRAIDELLNEFKNTTEYAVADIAARAEQLDKLIALADQKLAELNDLQNVKAETMKGKTGLSNLVNEVATDHSLNARALAATVKHLLDTHADEAAIAKELGISRGELRLLAAVQNTGASQSAYM